MNNTNLKYTKIKLTVIFTILVFALAVLLEWVYFSAKYYNYVINEEKKFNTITRSVENKYVSLNELVNAFDIWKKVFKMRNPRLDIRKDKHDDMVNLLIIDRNKKELVFSNVVNDLTVDFVNDILSENEYWQVLQEEWFLIKKIKVNEKRTSYDVLFIKELKYNFWDYLTDLLGFIFITLIFSAWFYYAWYRFVSKNLEPVEANLKDMQDFIHNAWHELKTPIAIIHSNLQLIKETKTYEKELVVEWLTEINRLNHLIESLVELSNINSSEYTEETNINNEIKTIIKDFKVEAEKKDIKIKFNKTDEKNLTINKQYFYILFSNLIWNAIKYSEKWWKIEITLDRNKITIKDNWVGISKENLEKIFDRFYMVEQSRNNEWHGIWLSLVKKIADIYKWKIKVKSDEGEGSQFVIEF